MKKSSLFILLMASSIVNAHAMWNGDEEFEIPPGNSVQNSVRLEPKETRYKLGKDGQIFYDGLALRKRKKIEGWACPIILDFRTKQLRLSGWGAVKGTGPAKRIAVFYKGVNLGILSINQPSHDVTAHYARELGIDILGVYDRSRFQGTLDLSHLDLLNFKDNEFTVIGFDDQNSFNVLQRLPVVQKGILSPEMLPAPIADKKKEFSPQRSIQNLNGQIKYRLLPGVVYRGNTQLINENGVHRINESFDGRILGHENNQNIHVEPFSLSNQSRGNFNGFYTYVGSLENHLKLTDKENGRIIYCDNENRCYIPHLTQDKLEKDVNSRFGLFVASFNSNRRANFIDGVVLPAGGIPRGLYSLVSIQDHNDKREETWRGLSDPHEEFKISGPIGCSSIPGMGTPVPHVVSIPLPQMDIPESSETLSTTINQHIVSYLRSEGARRIVNYCRAKIDRHNGFVSELREDFQRVRNIFKSLKSIPIGDYRGFVDALQGMIDVRQLQTAIEHLEALRHRIPEVLFRTEEWTSALKQTRQRLKKLAAGPVFERSSAGVFTVKGTLLGTRDILHAYRLYPQTSHIRGFGLNTIWIDHDQEFKAPGVSLSLIAPKWKMVCTDPILLGGRDGNSGANGVNLTTMDGQPGLPGGNGGQFYGKAHTHTNLDQLTIDTSAGRGGNGGSAFPGSEGGQGGAKAQGGSSGRFHFASLEQNNIKHIARQSESGLPGTNTPYRTERTEIIYVLVPKQKVFKNNAYDPKAFKNGWYNKYSNGIQIPAVIFQQTNNKKLKDSLDEHKSRERAGNDRVTRQYIPVIWNGKKLTTNLTMNQIRKNVSNAPVPVAIHKISEAYKGTKRVSINSTDLQSPQTPMTEVEVNSQNKISLEEYQNFYKSQSVDPLINPFMRVFSNLFEEI